MKRTGIIISHSLDSIPCKKTCTKRQVGCHSKCEKYINWQIKNEHRKLIERNSKEGISWQQ